MGLIPSNRWYDRVVSRSRPVEKLRWGGSRTATPGKRRGELTGSGNCTTTPTHHILKKHRIELPARESSAFLRTASDATTGPEYPLPAGVG